MRCFYRLPFLPRFIVPRRVTRKHTYTRPVIEAMRQGPFSLLMNETTDNTAEKEAVLLSIFFDNNLGRIVWQFYGLPICNIATGQTLFELIEDTIKITDFMG